MKINDKIGTCFLIPCLLKHRTFNIVLPGKIRKWKQEANRILWLLKQQQGFIQCLFFYTHPILINMLSGSLWVNTSTNKTDQASPWLKSLGLLGGKYDCRADSGSSDCHVCTTNCYENFLSLWNLRFGCTALKLFPDMVFPVSAQTEDSNGWRICCDTLLKAGTPEIRSFMTRNHEQIWETP